MPRATLPATGISVPPIRTRVPSPRRAKPRHLPLLLPILLVFASAPDTALSAASGLSGNWRGSGWVAFSSGQREQARCRVHLSEQSPRTVAINAVCATESGKVSQQAIVRKAGGNSYVGSFYNDEYGVSGSIHLSVRGTTGIAKLMSHSGSAVISLNR